ncbi:MAG: inner rane protein [Myxococcaceae bacterium]|nr:inner rane protein [Myxococcaceae bacterium]
MDVSRRSALVALGVVLAVVVPAVAQRLRGRATVRERLVTYEPAVRARLAADLAREGLAWPPRHLWLVALKRERMLRVYAAGPDARPRHLRDYPVRGASGGPGPKLRQGDGQVPEGIYGVESLNPNSHYHLALRVDYPSADDRAQAAREGRRELGGDIMIHGSNASVGCLAMGDEAAEDLFVLAARAGVGHVRVWIAPVDLRAQPRWTPPAGTPRWMDARYRALRDALSTLP